MKDVPPVIVLREDRWPLPTVMRAALFVAWVVTQGPAMMRAASDPAVSTRLVLCGFVSVFAALALWTLWGIARRGNEAVRNVSRNASLCFERHSPRPHVSSCCG